MDTEALEHRIQRLERQNAVMKVAFAGIVVVLMMAMGGPTSQPSNGTGFKEAFEAATSEPARMPTTNPSDVVDRIYVRRLIAVDDNNRVCGVFGYASGDAILSLFDEDGKTALAARVNSVRAELNLRSQNLDMKNWSHEAKLTTDIDSALLSLDYYRDGSKVTDPCQRAMLECTGDAFLDRNGEFSKTCSLSLRDVNGIERVVASTKADRSAIAVRDAAGNNRAVIGNTDLVTEQTGEETKTPESSVTLFGTKGKVLWREPR